MTLSFLCVSVTTKQTANQIQGEVILEPTADELNSLSWSGSPMATIRLVFDNVEAITKYIPGNTYNITISEDV